MKKGLLLLAFSFLACSHQPLQNRAPSSVLSVEAQKLGQEILAQEIRQQRIKERIFVLEKKYPKIIKGKPVLIHGHKSSSASNLQEVKAYEERLKLLQEWEGIQKEQLVLKKQLENQVGDPSIPESLALRFDTPWRLSNERVVLGKDWQNYLIPEKGKIQKEFAMDRSLSTSFEVELLHYRYSGDPQFQITEGQATRPYMFAAISCDAPFRLKRVFSNKKFKASEQATVRWHDSGWNGEKIKLYPDATAKRCEVFFRDPETGKQGGFALIAGKETARDYAAEICILPKPDGLPKPEQFFLNADFESYTCPQTAENLETLEDPVKALQYKAKELLGTFLSEEFLAEKNPFASLDFSEMPKLDEIYVSYLVFRGDFYGHLMARLLSEQAKRGAKVRVLVSDVITLDKDRLMLEKLAHENPNIKVQFYAFESQEGDGLKDLLDELHRTMHVKIFAGISHADPERNFAYIGGRNIHDAFAFKQITDHSARPEMVQYGPDKDEAFVHWRDFEYKGKGRNLVDSIINHFLTLWNRDSETILMRNYSVNTQSSKKADASYFAGRDPLVRHLISVPYKDKMALEKYFTQLIDSAEKSLLLSTPYFRPTEMIADALERALARGVDVTIITRLDLEGDTIDWLLSDANKAGVNKFYDRIKIYEYTEPKVILHTKLVIVDGRMSLLGSINLNKRSFYHDMENATLIYSEEFAARMERIYRDYLKDARLIDGKLKVQWLKKFLLFLFDKEF